MAYEVFISYAREDKRYLTELIKHLQTLQKQKLISTWHDGDINPGTEWEKQLMGRLNSAQIIILLISSDFIASDFCYGKEMEIALQRYDNKEAVVLPIILRPVDWKGTPFSRIQVLPENAKPVTRWSSIDEAFTDISKGIRKAIKDLDDLAKAANP